jgi:hypothetical protein
MFAAIKNCNTLPTIQRVKQNGEYAIDIRVMQVDFEVVLETRGGTR